MDRAGAAGEAAADPGERQAMSKRMAAEIESRLLELATLTETPGQLTRLAFSPPLLRANALVQGWMRQAGMTARIDAAGNVIGRYEGAAPGAPALVLGSHLDTVRDAGRFDGMLGVVAGIACVAELAREGARLPFAIEVMGFNDEEGVRFGTSIGGARAVAGRFDPAALTRRDAEGITLAEAMTAFGLDPARIQEAARDPAEILAYLELHIEQGPVLESEGLALGCVTSIAAAQRATVTLQGEAGHAGTVPMKQRRDALTAAAECILAVEAIARETGIVGTVGELLVLPGASNVIPGRTQFSLDLRCGEDAPLALAASRIAAACRGIATERGLTLDWEALSARDATPCAPWIMDRIDAAIGTVQNQGRRLPSGAGHDALAMGRLAPFGMIFVRSRGGISHNPAEMTSTPDLALAASALLHLVRHFDPPRG